MEARTILIANTKTQRRDKIESTADTLGELKAELDAKGIDYTDMTFTEGISKITFETDDAQLPQQVNYKGSPTTSLVMLLTNTRKKIASGADLSRSEVFQIIKDNSLGDAIKDSLGKCYSRISTDDLCEWLDGNEYLGSNSAAGADEIEEADTEEADDTDEDSVQSVQDTRTTLGLAIETLLGEISPKLTLSDLEGLDSVISPLVSKYSQNAGDTLIEAGGGSITNGDVDSMIEELA